MKHDEADLVRRLTEVDRQPSFDAEAFAARVIVEHARRRYRRRVVAGCGVATLTLVSLASSLFRDKTPEAFVKDSHQTSGEFVIRADPSKERTDVMLQTMSLESIHQEQQVNELLRRIENAKAMITEMQKEQNDHMLALYRAKFSGHIAVPDPDQLYDGVVSYPSN